MTQPVDTLISARWIIPVDTGVVHENAALAIHNGRIEAIVPAAEAQERFAPAEHIDRPGHALIPGLVNAHTHAPMTLLRGSADDLALQDWLHGHIWPAEKRWIGSSFVHDGTELAIAEMLRSGTTCFNDMYFFPDVVARTVAAQGMRASIGMIVVDFPSAWADSAAEYIDRGLAVRDEYRDDPLLSVMFAPHAVYTVAESSLDKIRRLSDQLDAPVHIHLQETAQEVADSVAATGLRPLERLRRLGLLTPGLLAVHMTQLEDEEIEIFAEAGASVAHCPESNLKLASGFCPVERLRSAGINVALGTDGAASNNDLDMLAEMRTAALLAKGVAADPTALPAPAALHMATLAGARALGLGDETGSLAPGKWADVACIDLDHAATQPVYDPVSQIVYAAGREQVSDVWVAGRQLLAGGNLTRLDERAVRQRAQDWCQRISAGTSEA